MSKKKLMKIYNKIKEIIGEDELYSEMDNIYETEDVTELSLIELESLINYLTDEYVLDSELSALDDKSQYVTDLDIDDY
jgi:hypothetical protein